ncbi:MAG: hypothetical protein HXY30_13315 [Pseudorhodoplanes sp.]|nr:hypothetical protein [Pseudorhodoplanes sp.]
MAYDATNPPQLIAQGIGGKGKVWLYKHTDAETAFDDTDYITNAEAIGMTTGDVVHVIDSTNGLYTLAQVTLDADGNGTLSAPTAFA